jgi:hypothetical protein
VRPRASSANGSTSRPTTAGASSRPSQDQGRLFNAAPLRNGGNHAHRHLHHLSSPRERVAGLEAYPGGGAVIRKKKISTFFSMIIGPGRRRSLSMDASKIALDTDGLSHDNRRR